MIAKLLLQNTFFVVALGALLFATAGTLDWPAAIAEKRPASSAGERLVTRLREMRVSMERISFTGRSGSTPRTTFCNVVRNFVRSPSRTSSIKSCVGVPGGWSR